MPGASGAAHRRRDPARPRRAAAALIARADRATLFLRGLRQRPRSTALEDAAVRSRVPAARARLAFTTDCYVVQPLFFPGGDIGKLAVCGTVNDLAMVRRRAAYLSPALSSRRACRWPTCERVVRSMAGGGARGRACASSPATPRWSSGARPTGSSSTPPASAWCPHGVAARPAPMRARATRSCVSGAVGDHGVAIMCQREGLRFDSAAARATARRSTAWSRPCSAPARDCTRCATPRAAAWPRRSTRSRRVAGRHRDRRGRRARARRGARGLRAAGPGPALRRQRGQAGAVCRPGGPRRSWPRCARTPWAGGAVGGDRPPPRPGAVTTLGSGCWYMPAGSSCRGSARQPRETRFLQET